MQPRRCLRLSAICLFFLIAAGSLANAADVLLQIRDVPKHRVVVAHVDLTEAARWCKLAAVHPESLKAVDQAGRELPFQFVPDPQFHPKRQIAGTVVLRLPSESDATIRLTPAANQTPPPPDFDGTVRTSDYEIVHPAGRQGGLPSKITFVRSGKVFDSLRWHDRTYHAQRGSFRLIEDDAPHVERIARGPLCTVVRTSADYVRGNDRPDSKPSAVYQWFYFHDLPLAYVTTLQRQQQPFAWKEWHFLELIYPGHAFTRWAGAEPEAEGEVAGSGNTTRFSHWAALIDGPNAIGMMKSGRLLVHDGRGAYGTYLHAFGDLAWQGFSGTERKLAAWLWIGTSEQPTEAIRTASQALPTSAHVSVTVDRVQDRLAEAEERIDRLDAAAARRAWWQLASARQLQAQGRYRQALAAAAGELPDDWISLLAGDLALAFERTDRGMTLLQLADLGQRRQLLAAKPRPLFRTLVRHAETKEECELAADAGWKQVRAETSGEGAIVLRWEDPADERLAGLTVEVLAKPEPGSHRITWDLSIDNVPEPWGVWRTVFPQVSLAEPGPKAEIFYPRGAGEVKSNVWSEAFRFTGTYPSGWMSMPYMAVYGRDAATGLYTAIHDPSGGTKDLLAESRPADRAVDLSFDHPAPDMGRPGTDFDLEGSAVWQLLPGDWFDASVIYRDWVRSRARWYPQLGPRGRQDTPEWMRNLSCWALASGTPEQVVPAVKEFQEAIGLPVGVHWYNWHQIPFDNDYPHYFPTRPGFAEGVAELQSSGDVFVMPYINGRLWDTRDRGTDVFEFDEVARPAATKNEAGEPYTERYGSKESDGSRVSLAAMCPTTDLWKKTVRRIVLRLMNECGVRGVYIDQIAAAKPHLCFDASHGHPLGGGNWWTQGYWDLLAKIRAPMPDDRILTTECNAEPYIHRFDGYLTWHWQYDGQVPAFAAVYGGAIQMFGRAYRGGPTKNLALRMKAGQQFLYGEQIGWINPSVTGEPENLAFLRQMVHLRAKLVDYFVRGEMARPPQLEGDIPTVTADWQWRGVWPVTTDALMTGAWRLPNENRAVLIFVNVSDQSVEAEFHFDAVTYGLPNGKLAFQKITAEHSEPGMLSRKIALPAQTALAWEIHAQ